MPTRRDRLSNYPSPGVGAPYADLMRPSPVLAGMGMPGRGAIMPLPRYNDYPQVPPPNMLALAGGYRPPDLRMQAYAGLGPARQQFPAFTGQYRPPSQPYMDPYLATQMQMQMPQFDHNSHGACSTQCHGGCCGSRLETSKPTKAIPVRGVPFRFRKSFLAESPKFEADLIKYMEKKKDSDIPDRIVEMLQDFINEDKYTAGILHEEVVLNILATNVGAKSAVVASLASINKRQLVTWEELADVAPLILLSGKVDDGLKTWLKKMVKESPGMLFYYSSWVVAMRDFPELENKYAELVGVLDSTRERDVHPI